MSPTLGIPGRRALWEHRKRLPEEKSRELWEECLRRLIDEHWQFDEFREEVRIVGIDGIAVKSIYTAEVRDPDSGEVVNADRVTKGFEGGSAINRTLPKSKSGHGTLVVVPATVSRLAVGVPVTQPMPGDEHQAARTLVREELARTVKPHLDRDREGVFVTDGGFFEHKLIGDIYELGYLPQIHPVAHPFGGLDALGLNPDGSPRAAEPDVELAQEMAAQEDPEGTDAKLSKTRLKGKLADTRGNYIDRVSAR